MLVISVTGIEAIIISYLLTLCLNSSEANNYKGSNRPVRSVQSRVYRTLLVGT